MNREDAGGMLFCVGHAYLDKSLHDQQDCYCLITEFRREATSHDEQGAHDGIPSRSDIARSAKQSKPTQVPEAARRAGMTMQQYDRWLVDSNMLLTMFSQDISKGKIS